MLAVIFFVLITYSTTNIHSIITTSKPQEIKYRKKAIDNSLGEPLTIWCSVSHPSTIISAYFVKANDKKGISKVDGRLISSQNTSYTFHKPTVNDAAQWKCLLKTSTGEEGAYLEIYSRPVLLNTNDSKVQYVYEGKDLPLNCIVKGHPKPVTKWTRKEIPIPYRNKEYNITGSSLTLKNVHQDKGGIYICTAINKFRVNGSEHVYKTIMEHEIKVKSELGWILPLIIIIVTLIVLVTVIGVCEWRKRNIQLNSQEYE
ncbi:Immunoglobulin subtype 2 domain and Immunoglobulin subtype domain and Immunoglobulin-like domain and Immunoglobulin I-set domain and Immunoglobulin-like fold domain-containing protein [Strongyloides ratti]|uniref:Immunoglobulin subtype 2 domain and Immunoglobulin subtype domain and Immunoglobulin-like domain and Immunoglobulin I-set domain and Immunoglobulin-like fold domain-containing protein n=1 Tax=Strongyloides ratti TaxID=34506 RepID=A0A090LC46_STRRB|nr:Immunoglobulin subtype 2 domain and Immunoglobulin subtype domain and Immunoglobulin-like domain and Immunoglobulin I-set domain and Immunoglobulin-like fold domain-containing protein [Strongyloides ratti]CEF67366.1 Immunoglobulin subtype 2 domain and Immunoglobulin subtype domain and Immunoglobulin-like domain and Immunoglobulin I-set domain and Immunoglobulin-like fold domain-containing protein [Strongyloides ratti]